MSKLIDYFADLDEDFDGVLNNHLSNFACRLIQDQCEVVLSIIGSVNPPIPKRVVGGPYL